MARSSPPRSRARRCSGTRAPVGRCGASRSAGSPRSAPRATLLPYRGDGSVALIDLRSVRLAAALPARNGPFAPAIAFFPDGRTLLTGGVAGRLTVWDTRSHTVLRTVKLGAPVLGADVSPDGRLI